MTAATTERAVERWRLAQVEPGDREEFWRHLVSGTHLPWTLDVDRDADPPADAQVVRRRLGDLDLIDTRCGPCGGRRLRSDIRRTPGEFVGLLAVWAGREVLTQDDAQIAVGPGDVVAWHAARPIRFDVLEPLRKQTLLIPLARFQEIARRPELTTARLLPASGARDLLTGYLGFLTSVSLTPDAATGAGNAALDLLGAALGTLQAPYDRDARHHELRQRVKGYVEAHLADAALTPRAIAGAHAISPRLLYSLFEEESDTVQAYVRRRRLARAHADLTRPGAEPAVQQVARHWGFADPAHFSRAFRAQYGYPPSEARRGR